MTVREDKLSLMDGLAKAESRGEESLLEFLENVLEECEDAKWSVAGKNHSNWKRDWAILHALHIVPKDNRMPWPTEPLLKALVEGLRPVWGDNPPVNAGIVPLFPGLEENTSKLRALMKWGVTVAKLDDMWDQLYDYGPGLGTVAGKLFWNNDKQVPGLAAVDTRAVYMDPLAQYGHRNARVIATKFKVDVGELAARFPKLRQKIEAGAAGDDTRKASKGDYSLLSGADRSPDGQPLGSKVQTRTDDVVEMWICPDIAADVEDVLESGEGLPSESEDDDQTPMEFDVDDWLVYTFIPGAGLISKELVKTGLQIGTGQWWRSADSWLGYSDCSWAGGVQLAHDQIAIRGHLHRLSMFSPFLVNPKDSGVKRSHLSGRPGAILEPSNFKVAEGLRYIPVEGPNKEAMEAQAQHLQTLKTLLNTDKISPDLLKDSTASGMAMVVAAMEDSPRQKIRNMRPMIEDLLMGLLRLTIDKLPEGIVVGDEESGFYQLTTEELEQIDLRQFSIDTGLGKPGPLSKQARMSAREGLLKVGALDLNVPIPMAARMGMIDDSELPEKEEIKRELLAMQQAAMMAPPVQPNEGAVNNGSLPPAAPPTTDQLSEGADRRASKMVGKAQAASEI